MMKNRMTRMTALCAALVSHTGLCYEQDDYRYELVRGEQLDVCRHMLGVYNQHFSTRPHDFLQVTEVNGVTIPEVGKDDLWLFELKSSFYPSSPEFEAVKWNIGALKFPDEGLTRAFIWSHLDIDNDGQDEVVIKHMFNLGDADGSEMMLVFDAGDVDLSSSEVPLSMLNEGIDGKHRPQTLAATQLRPFIYRGVVYLHQYDYRHLGAEENFPTDSDVPFMPPETVTIWKFLNNPPGARERGEARRDVQCEYRMDVIAKQQ